MSYIIRYKEPPVPFRGAPAARFKQAVLADQELDITTKSISALADVYSAMSPNDGEVLTYDTTNGWQSEVPSGGGGGSAWGGITGTLSDQTDLQGELDAKSDTGHTHLIANITDFTDNSSNWDTAFGWGDHSGLYESAFAKNTAFNLNFGTSASDVCVGNDSRLSDARTPTTHTHTESDITDLNSYSLASHNHDTDYADIATETPSGGTTGQVLEKIDGTDYNTQWATPSGGGATKDYAHFYLSGAGNTGLTNTEVTLTLNATGEVSNSLASIATNIITIAKTGIFKIEVSVYLNNSSTSRTEYSMWLEQEGVEMAGTRFASYQRGYDSGMSSGVTTIANVTSGDEFTIQCQRTDGGATTGYQDSNGTSVVITEL